MIYLAAGNSRRFGNYEVRDEKTGKIKKYTNKLLYKLDEKPMYLYLLERLLNICERHSEWEVLVVTQYREIYREVLKLKDHARPIRPVWSPDSVKGVSYSVKAGVLAALARQECKKPECGGVLQMGMEDQNASEVMPEACAFFVADQPYLTEKSAEDFLREMEMHKAALGSVRCRGQAGNPTWFSRAYFRELLELAGDKGGRKVLMAHPEAVRYYEIEHEKELQDIDHYSG